MSIGSLGQVKSVSQINAEIRHLLDSEFRFVRVRGEISTVRQPFSGHTYFILKDHQSQLPAVLFKNQRRWLAGELKEGQQVVCDGRISVYEPRGQYQLIVDTIDFDGTGQLRILFDQLKQKLKEEGLFDQEHKVALPPEINHVVVVTSPTGAAVHDFISVCTSRRAALSIQILPVRVQGQGAADEICRAIETAHSLSPDVIVLCRGGGSIEDLWSYNEEIVARTIYEATIPLVTGIGHETDFTIADFCADLRCATPTAAAELITTDPLANEEKTAYYFSRLLRSITLVLDAYEVRLNRMADMLSTFDKAFSHHTFAVEHLFTKLHNSMAMTIEQKRSHFSNLHSLLLHLAPDTAIIRHQDRLTFLSKRLLEKTDRFVQARQARLEQSAAVLDTLSPLKTLARGYGIVSKKLPTSNDSGNIITSTSQVAESEEVEVKLHKGAMDCRVVRKKT
ncbi:MAG: exodeoxyribonuclease VII large subunit [Desulfofustis sp.]|nr:exodeoxyribonuclease VII large subunit [Desulfofustis sp.]